MKEGTKIPDICCRIGLEEKNFYYLFKKRECMTPQEYRRIFFENREGRTMHLSIRWKTYLIFVLSFLFFIAVTFLIVSHTMVTSPSAARTCAGRAANRDLGTGIVGEI